MTYIRRIKQGLTGGCYDLMAIREIVLYSLWVSVDCGFDYFPDMRSPWAFWEVEGYKRS